MSSIIDPIAIRHPDIPGEFTTVGRSALDSYLESGWVEAKSPEAKAAVEAITTPSKETNK